MTETYVLNARTREKLGSAESKRIKNNGEIPAVIYGKDGNNEHVILSAREFEMELEKGDIKTKIAEIKLDKKTIKALVRQIEIHPVSDKPVHIDFENIDGKKEVKAKVRINYIGKDKSPGVKRGGFLNKIYRSIEVACTPDNIPSVLTVDIAEVHIGDKITSASIALPEGVKFTAKKDVIIASLTGRGKSRDEDEEATEGEGKSAEA